MDGALLHPHTLTLSHHVATLFSQQTNRTANYGTYGGPLNNRQETNTVQLLK